VSYAGMDVTLENRFNRWYRTVHTDGHMGHHLGSEGYQEIAQVVKELKVPGIV
jgi:hypothetical protein